MQLECAHVDDVAVEVNRYLEQPDEKYAKLRGDELKLEGQYCVNEIRQRNCKQQVCDRDKGDPEERIAADCEHDPHQGENEANLRKNPDRAQFTRNMHRDREQDQGGAGKAWPTNARPQCIAARPQQQYGYHWDQVSVAVLFLPAPATDQFQ